MVDSSQEDEQKNVVACLSKVQDISYMYWHLLLYLVNRILKVLRQMIHHAIKLEPNLVTVFRTLEAKSKHMGDAFSLTKSRIEEIGAMISINE